jgi:hypothetical protein
VQSCKSCLKQERKENVDEENDDGALARGDRGVACGKQKE